jgi:hypothetical protein
LPIEDKPSAPLKKFHGFRWGRLLLGLFAAVCVLIVALALTFRYYGYDLAKAWLESPSGARVAGQELGKAIKVDGTFAPMHLDGWTIQTDSFTSTGWPGEAIGSFDCTDIHATFDPEAIWKRAWRFSGITTEHAVIRLLKPNDALKRVMPPKKPKPWYAIFLPDHFECGPIISPHGDILFYFQGVDAGIHDAHVQADLIARDLKYTVTSGTLDFPYLPPLHINRLEMLVTRPSITIYTAQLVGLDPTDPSTLSLSGKIGMREDKSIDAKVDLHDMPVEKILPEHLRPLIHGKVSGSLVWHRNESGDDVTSDGDLTLTDAGIQDLSFLKAVAELDSNPDLHEFPLSNATFHYHLADNVVTLQLDARSAGKFHLAGTVVYDLKSKLADLDLVFDELPLRVWLPTDFKPRYSGEAKATLKWHGRLDTKQDSTGAITVNLDGAHISDPALLRELLEKKGLRTPAEIQFDKAQFAFTYANEIFRCTQAEVVAPGVISAQVTGSLAHDGELVATMDWQGLIVQDWLPENLAQQFSGALDGHAVLAVKKWKFKDGSYGGEMKLLNGEVRYTGVQSMVARFLDKRELLTLPLTRMQLAWTLDDRDVTVKNIDIRLGDDVGVKGDLASDDATGLSGQLWVGTKPAYLEWLPDAEKGVFTKSDDGLVWARVNISGTMRVPQQDLSTQIVAQLKRHPLALVGLGAKLVSWTVGNWFGEQEKWQRPVAKNVVVGKR